ncbi:MAG: RNA polymerase sigma factor [Polyangiaceae bacterium]
MASTARRPSAPSADATDAEVIARVREGDVGALGQLFDRYERDVRRVVVRLGVPTGDADDLVQATFLDVSRSAASYDGRASARPWLVGLAIVHVKRRRRSLARLAERLARWAREPVPLVRRPDESTELAETAARAQAALDRLSAKKREAFVLIALEGLTGEEVAAALDIPVATVWTRLHHARRELREALAAEDR